MTPPAQSKTSECQSQLQCHERLAAIETTLRTIRGDIHAITGEIKGIDDRLRGDNGAGLNVRVDRLEQSRVYGRRWLTAFILPLWGGLCTWFIAWLCKKG